MMEELIGGLTLLKISKRVTSEQFIAISQTRHIDSIHTYKNKVSGTELKDERQLFLIFLSIRCLNGSIQHLHILINSNYSLK